MAGADRHNFNVRRHETKVLTLSLPGTCFQACHFNLGFCFCRMIITDFFSCLPLRGTAVLAKWNIKGWVGMQANDCLSGMQQRKLSDCLCEVPMGATTGSCTVITALKTRYQGVEQSGWWEHDSSGIEQNPWVRSNAPYSTLLWVLDSVKAIFLMVSFLSKGENGYQQSCGGIKWDHLCKVVPIVLPRLF